MIDKDTLKLLEKHEDFRTIRAGGKEYKWLLGRASLRVAQDKHGVDVMAAAESKPGEFSYLAAWCGCLPWEPELDFEAFADTMSYREMLDTIRLLNPTPQNGVAEAAPGKPKASV